MFVIFCIYNTTSLVLGASDSVFYFRNFIHFPLTVPEPKISICIMKCK